MCFVVFYSIDRDLINSFKNESGGVSIVTSERELPNSGKLPDSLKETHIEMVEKHFFEFLSKMKDF